MCLKAHTHIQNKVQSVHNSLVFISVTGHLLINDICNYLLILLIPYALCPQVPQLVMVLCYGLSGPNLHFWRAQQLAVLPDLLFPIDSNHKILEYKSCNLQHSRLLLCSCQGGGLGEDQNKSNKPLFSSGDWAKKGCTVSLAPQCSVFLCKTGMCESPVDLDWLRGGTYFTNEESQPKDSWVLMSLLAVRRTRSGKVLSQSGESASAENLIRRPLNGGS